MQQLISLGLSGFAYSGADIGGFTGGASPELLTRWFEIGAFTPVFRDHSAKDAPRAEPWVDGPAHLAIRRRFIDERYRLMPYLYALADQNARTGDPLMRPIFYDYPEMQSASLRPVDGVHGRARLARRRVAASRNRPSRYDICLPASGWYDYWTGLPVAPRKTSETPQSRPPAGLRPAGHDPAAPAAGAEHVRDAEGAASARHLSGRRLPRRALPRRWCQHQRAQPSPGD